MVCCYIKICTVLYVSVIILCVIQLLQIKFCIFEYSKRGCHFPKSIPGRLFFTRVNQELVRQILRRMKYAYGWLFVFTFYGPVNSSGHVKPTSQPLTLLLGKIRQTKRLTITSRVYARSSN